MNTIVAPSVLSADFGNLNKDIEMIDRSDADWFHIDVMDGNFVPNISFGFPIIKTIRKGTKKILDVHLMITNADDYLEDFKNAGADILTVHFEACTHLNRTVTKIQELGMKAGVAINPHTPVSSLENILPFCDMVLVMSVNPGYGGQKFISNAIEKVNQIANWKKKNNTNLIIEVDGGVNTSTGKKLIDAGANALVAGSFVFGSSNPSLTISDLKNL